MAHAASRVPMWLRLAARPPSGPTRAVGAGRVPLCPPRPAPRRPPAARRAEAARGPARGAVAAGGPGTAATQGALGGRANLPESDVASLARSVGLPDDRRSVGVYRACLLLPGPESRRFCVLGDSVLHLLATEAQFDAGVPPSAMHSARACVITNEHLAARGRSMGVASAIGPGAGQKRIADSVEALIGAVWSLHGRAAAEKWVGDWITGGAEGGPAGGREGRASQLP